MTYFDFLVKLVIVPIAALAGTLVWGFRLNKMRGRMRDGKKIRSAILIHVLLAVAYTTPWDNYLVASGVWNYNPRLVSGVLLGYVPLEEYLFFVLETILAGLWWWMLADRSFSADAKFQPDGRLQRIPVAGLLAGWLVFAALLFSGNPSFTYLSITLFWALPAMIVQAAFGADILWRYRGLLAGSILPPAIYLSLADILALRAGTWSISAQHSTGILFFGILPLEEAVFFLATATLIACGLTLLLAPESRARLLQLMQRLPGSRGRASRPATGIARR